MTPIPSTPVSTQLKLTTANTAPDHPDTAPDGTWPKSDPGTQVFSRLMGGPIGGYLILRRNAFVERIIPSNVKRRELPAEVMEAYRGPFPTPQSRRPMHVFPREILGSRPFLAQIEQGLPAPLVLVERLRSPAQEDVEAVVDEHLEEAVVDRPGHHNHRIQSREFPSTLKGRCDVRD